MPRFIRAGLSAVLLAGALPPAVASAHDTQVGDLVIQHPWARATPSGAAVAAGYLTIVNHGPSADTLTGGSLEAATAFSIHDTTTENGVMTMRPTGPIEIPPGSTVTLSPGRRHIMFSGLKRGLKKGESVGGTLVFTRAGTVPVHFEVEGIASRGPAEQGGHAMPGMTME